MIQQNDYQQCKALIEALKIGKQITIPVEKASTFRRYLTTLSKKANRSYITKVVSDKNVLVARIS